MPASLGAEREQLAADGTRYVYVPIIGWVEVCTADELLQSLETDAAPEGAASAEHHHRHAVSTP